MIGIDIGTNSIKICRVEEKGKGFFDIKYAYQRINHPVKPGESRKDVAAAIKSMCRKNGFGSGAAATSLGDPDILIRRLSLPPMPRSELKSSIKLQAEKFIFSDLSGMDMDFHIVETEQNQMDVLFVAAPSKLVDSRMDMIQKAGLDPLVMDIDSLAAANCYLKFFPHEDETVIVMDIGSSKTCFTLLDGNSFCFSKNVGFGGDHITREIKKLLNISARKSEDIKIKPELWQDIGLNIKNVLRKTTPDLLEAVYKAVEYCRSQNLIINVDKIILTGGTSLLKELDEFFVEIFGIETVRWNPFDNIKLLRDKASGPLMCVALGLAVRK